MSNLQNLIIGAGRDRPDSVFGTVEQNAPLGQVVERAHEIAEKFRQSGLRSGDIVALLGPNSASYLLAWMAAQLCGLRTALINPTYPDDFLVVMLDNLAPRAILWIGRDPGKLAERPEGQFELSGLWNGGFSIIRALGSSEQEPPLGRRCGDADIAAFVHTSGTSGPPKFCALSHGYFLRLGRFFADVLNLTWLDTLLDPLPMFHINPIGMGVVTSLVARSGFLSMDKFSPADFWPAVKDNKITAMVLHFAPASLLTAKTTAEEAKGHGVRIAFGGGPTFLRAFDVPIGLSGYGSTEAGGICHAWKIRPDDNDLPIEGPTNMAGKPRVDLEHRVNDDGEICVRGLHPLTLFSGYLRNQKVEPQTDEDGWFQTGDRGRLDELGNLIFIERMKESIRVNGEYVPIDFLEERLRTVVSLGDFAVWRKESSTRGHEVIVVHTSSDVNVEDIGKALADVPRYMHPVEIVQVAELPRDTGVGKIQRRLLLEQEPLRVIAI